MSHIESCRSKDRDEEEGDGPIVDETDGTPFTFVLLAGPPTAGIDVAIFLLSVAVVAVDECVLSRLFLRLCRGLELSRLLGLEGS